MQCNPGAGLLFTTHGEQSSLTHFVEVCTTLKGCSPLWDWVLTE